MPGQGAADALAWSMLARTLDAAKVRVEEVGVGSLVSEVVIAVTRGFRPVNGACAATMQDAKPCHVVTPEPVKW